jgi:hypothetical protein
LYYAGNNEPKLNCSSAFTAAKAKKAIMSAVWTVGNSVYTASDDEMTATHGPRPDMTWGTDENDKKKKKSFWILCAPG